MKEKPRACVITGYGINADHELIRAFSLTGAEPRRVHIRDIMDNPASLMEYQILAFPGGFSFGDHLGSGLVFARLFKKNLRNQLEQFIAAGGLIIGICNGFQTLVKMGVLPNLGGDWQPQVTLIHNDTGLFENSWIPLEFNPASPCVWTRGLGEAEFPIRHGEGRFFAAEETVLDVLESKNLVALRYKGRNPNGSQNNIAGICDLSGRVFGLMPHPEGFLFPENHPRWNREAVPGACGDGGTESPTPGLVIFRNAVEYAEKNL